MSLLSCRELLILLIFAKRRESFVEELAEDMSLASLIVGELIFVKILQVEIDDNIIQIVIRA